MGFSTLIFRNGLYRHFHDILENFEQGFSVLFSLMDRLPLLATQTQLPGASTESSRWVGDLGGQCGFGGSVQMKREVSSFLILFIINLHLHPELCILTSMSPAITSGIQMQNFQLRDIAV